MEDLKQTPSPLVELTGWHNNVTETHVVPSGEVRNSGVRNAVSGAAEYNALWDANKMDMLLYNWVRAVYLARVACRGVLASDKRF